MRETATFVRLRHPTPRTYDWVVAGLGLLAIFFLAANITGPVRATVTLAATLVTPGWAVVRQFAVREVAARWCFILATSIVVFTVVSLLMVWTGLWHPTTATITIFIVSVIATVLVPPRLTSHAPSGPVQT